MEIKLTCIVAKTRVFLDNYINSDYSSYIRTRKVT